MNIMISVAAATPMFSINFFLSALFGFSIGICLEPAIFYEQFFIHSKYTLEFSVICVGLPQSGQKILLGVNTQFTDPYHKLFRLQTPQMSISLHKVILYCWLFTGKVFRARKKRR